MSKILKEGDKVAVAHLSELDLTKVIIEYIPQDETDVMVLRSDEENVTCFVFPSGICVVKKNE